MPIIETEAQNISAYIPTNLISITDGQIYLSPKLFELGILPAVDVGKSVSRVGDKAQLPAYRSVGKLKLEYAQFEELETFARFGTSLDEATRKTIEHGKRIRECLKQNELLQLSVTQQLVVLLALTNGLFDTIPLEKIRAAEDALLKSCTTMPAAITTNVFAGKPITDDEKATILKLAADALLPFQEVKQDDDDKAAPQSSVALIQHK